jgi:hypothetical protein
VVRYGSQQEANLDMVSGRIDAMLADSVNLSDGFLKTDAGKGFEFVGPTYEDAKYFGGGAGIAVRKGDTELAENSTRPSPKSAPMASTRKCRTSTSTLTCTAINTL